jgi:hypothetical protein
LDGFTVDPTSVSPSSFFCVFVFRSRFAHARYPLLIWFYRQIDAFNNQRRRA